MTTAYLVTGTSRGIGRAFAGAIQDDSDLLFSLSSEPDRIERGWTNIQCDLSICATVNRFGRKLVQLMCESKPDALVLINNAAVIDPMGPLELSKTDPVVRHLHVNQAAPALLMAAFISQSSDFAGLRCIINISSGAARHPYAGWSMYCGAKAALDMMTLCVAMEQQGLDRPVTVCSVYPGKVDTGMQAAIRKSDPLLFPARDDFVRARENGELAGPHAVARMVIDLFKSGQFENGGIYDLRSAVTSDGQLSIDPIRGLNNL